MCPEPPMKHREKMKDSSKRSRLESSKQQRPYNSDNKPSTSECPKAFCHSWHGRQTEEPITIREELRERWACWDWQKRSNIILRTRSGRNRVSRLPARSWKQPGER